MDVPVPGGIIRLELRCGPLVGDNGSTCLALVAEGGDTVTVDSRLGREHLAHVTAIAVGEAVKRRGAALARQCGACLFSAALAREDDCRAMRLELD